MRTECLSLTASMVLFTFPLWREQGAPFRLILLSRWLPRQAVAHGASLPAAITGWIPQRPIRAKSRRTVAALEMPNTAERAISYRASAIGLLRRRSEGSGGREGHLGKLILKVVMLFS